MPLVAKNLTKKYAGVPVLDGINLKIGNGRKVGVVGRNGCGKSTLFKVLNRVEEPTSGHIEYENEILGYVPQEFNFPDELIGVYLEQLVPSWDYYKVEKLLSELEFDNYDPYQEIVTLSEGQKMKLQMITALLGEPTILFIDEPTNHLDIEGILWFERYIKKLSASVVLISHDREFLNRTVDEVWELEEGALRIFVGDYDTYKAEKLKLIDKWNEEYVRFVNRKKQLEELLDRARTKGVSRKGGVQGVKSRIDREINKNVKTKYASKKMQNVNFGADVHRHKLILRVEGLSKSYGERHVLSDLSFEIRGQEKIWLYGPNGAGKTTLVKAIVGEDTDFVGEVRLGTNIKLGYFAQKQTALEFDLTLKEHFMRSTGCEYAKVFGVLNKFLFDKSALDKRISNLSPGERARFAFAIFAHKSYDFLILDEPTNHLDIEAKEVIEESLSKFSGAVLLISHDRYFVERVGIDRVMNLKDRELTIYDQTNLTT